MRKSRFTEAQIVGVLRQVDGGLAVADVCREHAISGATSCKWRSKYGGMDASMISDMKAMEDENRPAETGTRAVSHLIESRGIHRSSRVGFNIRAGVEASLFGSSVFQRSSGASGCG
jgi:putative transposase